MRIVFSLLLVCLLSAGCAYTPDGEPKIIFNVTNWSILDHSAQPYNGNFQVFYYIKNIGTSDNTKLKKGYSWAVSIPIIIKKSTLSQIKWQPQIQ